MLVPMTPPPMMIVSAVSGRGRLVSSFSADLHDGHNQCCMDYFFHSNALQLQLLGSVK